MKKLFKKVETKTIESTMEEVTSKIVDEHYAAIEEMEKLDETNKRLTTEEGMKAIDDIFKEIHITLDEAIAYRQGVKDGMKMAAKAGLAGVVVGLGVAYKILK